MNDVVIFTIGLGVMGVVIVSAFIALIASDHPDEPSHSGTDRIRDRP
jgi:hypothetical protein